MIYPTIMRDMKFLICGFDAYGERDINNAWEVTKYFREVPNIDILKLPVSFNRAHKVIIEALACKQYDLILILGETGFTTDYVRLERLAINYKDSTKPDIDGITADDEDLIPGAPKAWFTAFPVKKITAILKEKGNKVKVTNSTGTYVCNSVYFNILHYLSEKALPVTALFVHLPVSTEIVSLSEMRQTVMDIIEEYKKLQNIRVE